VYAFIKFATPVRERDLSQFSEGGKVVSEVTLQARNSKGGIETGDGRKSKTS
jgi:hypothetical protein